MKFNDEIQKFLPLGYLFLVILGIIKESIFYYQLNINILKYSSLMDILISPIADLTAYPILILFLFIIFIILYIIRFFSIKNHEKEIVKKFLNLKDDHNLTKEEIILKINLRLLSFFFFYIVCIFVGWGIGGGNTISKKIKNGSLNYVKHGKKLTLSSGESKEVYLIDTNNLYYFYVVKGEKTINISPVGAIQNIELKNK